MKPARKTNAILRNRAAVRRFRARNVEYVREDGRIRDRARYASRRTDPQKSRDYWNTWRLANINRERTRGRADLDAGYHVDHITALAKGGTNGPENLQLLCPPCDTSKADDCMFDFYLRKMGGKS